MRVPTPFAPLRFSALLSSIMVAVVSAFVLIMVNATLERANDAAALEHALHDGPHLL